MNASATVGNGGACSDASSRWPCGEDVRVELRPIAVRTHCLFKGDASYWTIETEAGTHDDIAWSYEEPKEGAEDIRGLVAFFADRDHVVVGKS